MVGVSAVVVGSVAVAESGVSVAVAESVVAAESVAADASASPTNCYGHVSSS